MSDRLFDLSMVEEISGGNRDFIRQMIEVFLETVPEAVELMNKFYEEENQEGLYREAHKLKSTISTIQVPMFIDKLKKIENITKTGVDSHLLPSLMEEFNVILPEAIRQIQEYYDDF